MSLPVKHGIAVILCTAVMALKAPAASPVTQVSAQFREIIAAEIKESEAPKGSKLAATLRPDGSWADIDYPSQSRGDWPAMEHGRRVLRLSAQAAGMTTGREEVLDQAHKAFAYWIAHDFQSPNWWHNKIGMPKVLGSAGILLGAHLLPAEKNYLTKVLLPRSEIGMTGQNRIWLAGNTMILACLTDDEALAGKAAGAIWEEVRITPDEGIQADYSFHQHGPQQQFGNYGLSYCTDISQWAGVLAGTPWEIPRDRWAIFRDLLLKGESWVIWRGAMDIGALGRQIKPGAPGRRFRALEQVMKQCATLDPAYAEAYGKFVTRNAPGAPNDLMGTRLYWRSDYLVHRTADFSAELKMSSNRVIGAESLNKENLSGFYMGDGLLCLYRTGGEYREIYPVWDWNNLPGTTTAQGELPEFRESAQEGSFVGGVSQSEYGVAVMEYRHLDVSGRKAWFFAGDAIYCLGTGITGKGDKTVLTTINQCILQDIASGSEDGTTARTLASGTLSGMQWIEQGGFRYTMLETGPVILETGPVTGNWQKVFQSPSTPKQDIRLPIFKLQIPHGVAPVDGRYGWAVSPAGSKISGKVVANTPELQAVRMDENTFAIAFWEAGTSAGLSVDAPCVVLLRAKEKKAFLADPSQKLGKIRIKLGDTERSVPLPQGEMAGSTVEVSFTQ